VASGTAAVGLRLTLETAPSLPLDEALVGVVTVVAGEHVARVSSRVNLIEGDLVVVVSGPAGYTARCAWPWPADSPLRSTELAPGQHLSGAVPLLSTAASAPLFHEPGAYTLTARFDAEPGRTLSTEPCAVTRAAAGDEGRAAALQDRSVLQSLVSGSALPGARPGLRLLRSAATTTSRALAALAEDRLGELVTLVADGDADAAAQIVAAAAAVLPPGFADADPRRAAVEPLLAGVDEETAALFRGTVT
jgi:hypothetical protein